MTTTDFLRTIWRGRFYVLGATAVVILAALIYLPFQAASYRADALVTLQSVEAFQEEQLTEVTAPANPADVTSPQVAVAAAATLGYDGPLSDLTRDVTARTTDGDSTIRISAVTGDPSRSVEVANAFAAAYADYIDSQLQDRVARLDDRLAALVAQLAGVRESLARDPRDPIAIAEQDSLVTQHTAFSRVVEPFRSIDQPATVDPGTTEASRTSTGIVRTLAIAALAGLLAGVGLAFGRRAADVKVREASEVPALVEAPVLAQLNGVSTANRNYARTGVLPLSSKVATPFTESIRELRTAIQVGTAGKEHAIVGVTAADAYELRSFIVANLAASFALGGQTTIAVSGDLRRPQLEVLLPPPLDWSNDGSGLRPTMIPNLSLMSISDQGMDPADFLATPEARGLLADARARAEVLVIDTPPVLAAADSAIVGRYADGVVLVAAAGRTVRSVLAEAAERLRGARVPVLGVALADTEKDRFGRFSSMYGETQEPSAADQDDDQPPAEAVSVGEKSTPARRGSGTSARRGNGATANGPGGRAAGESVKRS